MILLILFLILPPHFGGKFEMDKNPEKIVTSQSSSSWMPVNFQVWTHQKNNNNNNGSSVTELPSWYHNLTSYRRFRLENSLGLQVELCSLGATVTSLKVPDKFGNLDDITLGFDNAQDYLLDSNPYMGATVGRVTNRISGGQFVIDNITYILAQNNGNNHLHGGIIGYDAVNWEVFACNDSGSVTFSYSSWDGEEGYPGHVNVFARYTLISGLLDIQYWATSTKKTPINIANHMYFNLAGHAGGKAELYRHHVQINAEKYSPVTAELIPTGQLENVAQTPFDLRVPTLLGPAIAKLLPNDNNGGGFDHNFVIWPTNSGTVAQNRFVSRVSHEFSGRTMEVYSNQPGVQFYTGNFLPNWQQVPLMGKEDALYEQHGGFCMETQLYPDAINQDAFNLKATISPGEIYYHNVQYSFGLLN